MRRSKIEVYLHLVWATRGREALLVGQLAELARRTITQEATAMGCEVLALNGMPDHLHLLVRIPATVAPAALAKQVKGFSSHAINDLLATASRFRWQEGYAVFSVSQPHAARVVEYIRDQQQRHAGAASGRSGRKRTRTRPH